MVLESGGSLLAYCEGRFRSTDWEGVELVVWLDSIQCEETCIALVLIEGEPGNGKIQEHFVNLRGIQECQNIFLQGDYVMKKLGFGF